MDTCEPKAVPKFGSQGSIMFDGKGKTNSNVSEHIHSVCKIAITTQERSKAACKWNEERRDSHESNVKKKSKSRKERQARTHKKHGGTDKGRA